MKRLLAAAAVLALAALPAAASATIVNVDASTSGCDSTHCSGEHVGPGTVLDQILSPTQLFLTAGSYTVTNANGLSGANPNFTAWNYNKGGDNWLWSFMAIEDDNKTVLLDNLPNLDITVVTTQAAAAAESAAVNYVGHFTLAHDATVDFVTEDYFPPDNLGGVALKVTKDDVGSSAPEPATWAMMLLGFGGLGAAMRRQRRSPAAA